MPRSIVAAAALATAAGAAIGGEAYTAMNGYALSGYDPVAYHGLAPDATATPGRASITADHDGASYAFASTANRDAFVADPARYLPAYDGHCAFGMSRGYKTAGAPTLWRVVDGVLYVNGSPRAKELWQTDIPGNIEMADLHWKALELDPAATDAPTGFDPATAPLAD